MVKEIDLYRESAALISEAEALENSYKVEARKAAEWEIEALDRDEDPLVVEGKVEEARLNRDWHLQLADTAQIAARKLRKKSDKLLKKAARKERNYNG